MYNSAVSTAVKYGEKAMIALGILLVLAFLVVAIFSDPISAHDPDAEPDTETASSTAIVEDNAGSSTRERVVFEDSEKACVEVDNTTTMVGSSTSDDRTESATVTIGGPAQYCLTVSKIITVVDSTSAVAYVE